MSITQANNKIKEKVTDAYEAVENGVVGTYKKIENKFVEAFLARDGESAAEAKERIIAEHAARIQKP